MPPLDHWRQEQPCEPNQCLDVQTDHHDVALWRVLPESSPLPNTRVVGQDLDRDTATRNLNEKLLRRVVFREVHGDRLHGHAEFAFERTGKLLQLVRDRRDNYEWMTVAG